MLNTTATERAYLQNIIENMANMLVILDKDLRIKKVNLLTCELLGFHQSDLLKKPFSFLLEKNGGQNAFFKKLTRGPIQATPKKYLTKNKEIINVLLATSILKDSQDIICVAQDISTLQKIEEKLGHLARYDMITGLPNRLLFKETLIRDIARCERSRHSFALLLFDIDHFKLINDRFGHPTGDLLLRKFAKKLQTMVRTEDFIARLGGDEFAIILTNEINIEETATRLLQRIAESSFLLNGKQIHITISMGIATFPQAGQTVTALIKNSDIALYQAKTLGRNGYQIYQKPE